MMLCVYTDFIFYYFYLLLCTGVSMTVYVFQTESYMTFTARANFFVNEMNYLVSFCVNLM